MPLIEQGYKIFLQMSSSIKYFLDLALLSVVKKTTNFFDGRT